MLIFYVFLVNLKNTPPKYSLNAKLLHIQLDLVTRIPNLQSELKNVENWQNGGLKSVDFLRFWGKMAKRVTYLSTNMPSAWIVNKNQYPGYKTFFQNSNIFINNQAMINLVRLNWSKLHKSHKRVSQIFFEWMTQHCFI